MSAFDLHKENKGIQFLGLNVGNFQYQNYFKKNRDSSVGIALG
jgi:hypothetical protein